MSLSNENNNFLTYNEFIISCLRLRDFLSPKKLYDAFMFFDIDNNDIIDADDLYFTFLRWGKEVTNKNDVENIIYFGTKKKYKTLDLNAFIEIFSDDINEDEFISQINILKENSKNDTLNFKNKININNSTNI